jgi:hypothetical protein
MKRLGRTIALLPVGVVVWGVSTARLRELCWFAVRGMHEPQ